MRGTLRQLKSFRMIRVPDTGEYESSRSPTVGLQRSSGSSPSSTIPSQWRVMWDVRQPAGPEAAPFPFTGAPPALITSMALQTPNGASFPTPLDP